MALSTFWWRENVFVLCALSLANPYTPLIIMTLLSFGCFQNDGPLTQPSPGPEFTEKDIVTVLFVTVAVSLQGRSKHRQSHLKTFVSPSDEDQSPTTLWCPQTWSWCSGFVCPSSLQLLVILTWAASRTAYGSCYEPSRCWVNEWQVTDTHTINTAVDILWASRHTPYVF